jgi:Domain of unknown function (DUF6265)
MISRVISLALVLAAAASSAGADAARLAWLEGRWTGDKDGVAMEEHWTSPAGGALVGMHKDVKGGRMVSFEFFRIETTPAGGLVYLASPAGAPVTPFTMIAQSDRRVVFENKAHDFPQRILYWLDDAGALHARIEGTQGGKDLHEDWVWTKAR